MTSLYTDLLPVPEITVPEFDERTVNWLLNTRRALWQDKIEAIPKGPTAEDDKNFILYNHRLHAQIELLNLMLESIQNQVTNARSDEQ